MAKLTTKFVCSDCGYESSRWLGKCMGCGTFGTMVEEPIEIEKKSKSAMASPQNKIFQPIQKIKDVQIEEMFRFSSGIPELDTVLGGGIVPASLVLIGGDPGIGKSTLLSQVIGHLSKENKTLYVSAEESVSQVKLRCNRLGIGGTDMEIMNENEMEKIESVLQSNGYGFAVIDSIQAIYLSSLTSASGSVSQIRECASRLMRIAKAYNVTIFIIGHVTKDGSLAGPKVLEHIMDTVLYFEGDETSTFKILRAVKNRFGSTNEVGIFEMQENGIIGVNSPSQVLLSSNSGKLSGSSVTSIIEGTRCMLVEIQALTSPTAFGTPRRMASGIDYNKFVLLLAVLEKKAGISLYNQDAYLNVMSGIKIFEPAVDLAVIASVISAVKNEAGSPSTAFFGEVGLTGEVRAVTEGEKRVNECIKMGYKKVILPYYNAKKLKSTLAEKIEIVPIRYLWEMKKILL